MSFLLGVALLIGLGLFVGLMGLGFLWFTAGIIGRLEHESYWKAFDEKDD